MASTFHDKTKSRKSGIKAKSRQIRLEPLQLLSLTSLTINYLLHDICSQIHSSDLLLSSFLSSTTSWFHWQLRIPKIKKSSTYPLLHLLPAPLRRRHRLLLKQRKKFVLKEFKANNFEMKIGEIFTNTTEDKFTFSTLVFFVTAFLVVRFHFHLFGFGSRFLKVDERI